MNSCEARKCRFWDGEKCNDKNDWITAEDKQPCCGLRSDAVLIEKEKRKPLPDGTLELTESEKTELAKLIGFSVMFRVVYNSDHLCAYISPYHKPITLDNIKAILWLAERFDLVEKQLDKPNGLG